MKKLGRKCNKLYRILGIDRSALPEEIKEAYWGKAKVLHPDVGGTDEDFIKLQQAFNVLSDPQKRRWYDQTGEWIQSEISEQTKLSQAANDILANYFNEALHKHKQNIIYADVISEIKAKINGQLEDIKKQLHDIRKTLGVVKKVSEKIEYKGESIDVFHGVLFGIEKENEHARMQNKEKEKHFKHALKVIKNYEFNNEIRSRDNVVAYKIFNTSTTFDSWR